MTLSRMVRNHGLQLSEDEGDKPLSALRRQSHALGVVRCKKPPPA